MAAHMDRLKLVVVGDSGVGKSSFISGIVNQSPLNHPSSTIGCSVEVLEYSYTGHHGQHREVFLEFWEIGGAQGHRDSRSIFYTNPNGLILVHDLTNRKSFLNLKKWVEEATSGGKEELTGVSIRGSKEKYDYNIASAATNVRSIPILVVGTKEDQGQRVQTNNRSAFHIGLADDSDVFFCEINSSLQSQLASSSPKWNVLNSFFQKVVTNRFYPSGKSSVQESDNWRGRKR